MFYNLVKQILSKSLLLNFYKIETDTKKNLSYFKCNYSAEIKIEPILVATKVTGSQVVEVAVTAYVLSTRLGMHKKPTSSVFNGESVTRQ